MRLSVLLCLSALLGLTGCDGGKEIAPIDLPRYRVAELNPPAGTPSLTDLNDSGLAAGPSTLTCYSNLGCGTPPPFVLGPNGAQTVGGENGMATAISDAGHVVGYAPAAGGTRAFLWRNGQTTDLGTLGGSRTQAEDVNSQGQVVGASFPTGQTALHAFLWQNGSMTDLGTMGGVSSIANAISDNGHIVGRIQLVLPGLGGDTRAFLWKDGTVHELPSLGGKISEAVDVNTRGQVVGNSTKAEGFSEIPRVYGVLWDNGVATDLGFGTLPEAINNAGLIVGSAPIKNAQNFYVRVAVMWVQGRMVDLNTLLLSDSGWVLEMAVAVNDHGQILGYGKRNGQTRHFILTPEFR